MIQLQNAVSVDLKIIFLFLCIALRQDFWIMIHLYREDWFSDKMFMNSVTSHLMQFACNAHTICDSELRPLGTGLYPVISIINHR